MYYTSIYIFWKLQDMFKESSIFLNGHPDHFFIFVPLWSKTDFLSIIWRWLLVKKGDVPTLERYVIIFWILLELNSFHQLDNLNLDLQKRMYFWILLLLRNIAAWIQVLIHGMTALNQITIYHSINIVASALRSLENHLFPWRDQWNCVKGIFDMD